MVHRHRRPRLELGGGHPEIAGRVAPAGMVGITGSSSGPIVEVLVVVYRELTDAVPDVAPLAAAASPTTALVSRREAFNAAHVLRNPELSEAENRRLYGKCANLHGHNYVVEVVVAGEIDPDTGYVVDLKRVADVICRRIIEDVDHRNLNTDVPWLDGVIPTAENLARAFWERIAPELPERSLRTVRVWETEKNWAEVGERG